MPTENSALCFRGFFPIASEKNSNSMVHWKVNNGINSRRKSLSSISFAPKRLHLCITWQPFPSSIQIFFLVNNFVVDGCVTKTTNKLHIYSIYIFNLRRKLWTWVCFQHTCFCHLCFRIGFSVLVKLFIFSSYMFIGSSGWHLWLASRAY